MLETSYAPDFRLYDFMNTKENGLSRCLAFLLNPQASHGQGDLYLRYFLEHLSVTSDWTSEHLIKSSVQQEKTTDKNRRIDIFIDIPATGVIGIENKPWAADGEYQLRDYADYLQQYNKNRLWLLVYLCNGEPSEYSIDSESRTRHKENKNWVNLSFAQLNQWLKICLGLTQPVRVRFFIEELMFFIDEKINWVTDMSKQQEIIEQLISTDESIESAFAIHNSMDSVKIRLMEKLKRDLEGKLESMTMKLEWSEENKIFSRYFCFSISFQEQEKQEFLLAFSFESKELNQLWWGISKKSGQPIMDERWNKINSLMSQHFGPSDVYEWWPWSVRASSEYFGDDFQNWEHNEKPWLAIRNGELVDKICTLAEKTKNIFDGDSILYKSK